MTKLSVIKAAGCAAALALGAGVLAAGSAAQDKAPTRAEAERVQSAAPAAGPGRAPSAGLEQARAAAATDADLPPNAKPGECYTRIFTPAEYQTVKENVLIRPESEKIEVLPPVFRQVAKQVLVKEESQKIEVVPARYEWVEERVLVKPEAEKVVTVPAVYETVTEQVLVKPAYSTWKKGRGPIERVDNATGEIMCLVEVPAEHKTITKQILKRPAETKTEKVPATYKVVKKQVMAEPPKTRTVVVPAEYKTETVFELVENGKEKRTKVPAQYAEVAKQSKVSGGKIEWRSILCQTNATADMVKRIQAALRRAGHDPGEIDGRIGPGTLTALRAYQEAKGLVSGPMTLETLSSLGVKL